MQHWSEISSGLEWRENGQFLIAVVASEVPRVVHWIYASHQQAQSLKAMYKMLSAFDLKAGIDVAVFRTRYAEFMSAMSEAGLVESSSLLQRRVSDTPMDTNDAWTHQFFTVMTFRDRVQLDASYDFIAGRSGAGVDEHLDVRRWVANPVFTCWADID